MSLNFDCEDPDSLEDKTQAIMDSIGNAYQTTGYIASLIGNYVLRQMTPSVISAETMKSSLLDYIDPKLQQCTSALSDCRRSLAVATSSAFGQADSFANRTINNCCNCCNCLPEQLQSPGILRGLTSNAIPVSTGYNPPYNPSIDDFGKFPPSQEPICPVPPVVIIREDQLLPQKPKRWCKWCNVKDGFSSILEQGLTPADFIVAIPILGGLLGDKGVQEYIAADWKNLGCSDSRHGPFPECTRTIEPQKPEEKPNQPTIFYRAGDVGGNVIIINLPETEDKKPPDLYTPDSSSNKPNIKDVASGCDINFYTGPAKGGILEASAAAWQTVLQTTQSLWPWDIARTETAQALQTVLQLTSAYSCNNASLPILQQFEAALHLISHLTGITDERLLRRLNYDMDRLCPTIMPSADQSLRNYLANSIQNEAELKKYVELNGHCWEPYRLKIQAERSKYVPDEIFALTRRGLIQPQYTGNYLRELGYLFPEQWKNLEELQKYIPVPQDIVRFMVRDVQDESIVNKFRLSDQFPDKFNGKLEEWAKYQAVDKDVMLKFWQAHWRVPELHQLSEMYQRNRRHPYDSKKLLTLEDIRTALGQADYLPFWQDKLEDLLFRPISQRYIYEVYHFGGVDETELFEHLCFVGYNDRDAAIVSRGFKIRKQDGLYNSNAVHLYKQHLIDKEQCKRRLLEFKYEEGFVDESLNILDLHFDNHPDIKLYRDGIISYHQCWSRLSDFGLLDSSIETLLEGIVPNLRFSIAMRKLKAFALSADEAKEELTNEGVKPEIASLMVDAIDNDLRQDLTDKCRANVKHDYLHGAFTQQEAINKLIQFNVSLSWANQLVVSWECEKKSQGKTIPTSTLCDWFSKGIIQPEEFHRRLTNVGYEKEDAWNIVSDCIDKINQKAQQRLAKQAAELRRQLDNDKRDREKEEAKAENRLRNSSRAREAAKKAEDKRRSALMLAAAKLAKQADLDSEDASTRILQLYNQLKADFGATTDQSIEAIQRALVGIDTSNYEQLPEDAANYFAAAEIGVTVDDETEIPL